MVQSLAPTPADQFSRIFASSFDETTVVPVTTAFQSFFGDPAQGGSLNTWSTDAATVDIDIIRANGEQIAALVPRGGDSIRLGTDKKNIQLPEWTAETRKWPLFEEEGPIQASELLLRNPGENPYAVNDRQARMRDRAMRIFRESVARIMRAREVLAAQSILNGTQELIFGTTNTDLEYDWKRTTALNWTVSTDWATITTDIGADVDTACDLVRENGHVTPDGLFLGGTAITSIQKNTEQQTLADNRRFEVLWVSKDMSMPARFQRYVDAGWDFRGKMVTAKGRTLYMFSNNEIYTDLAGSTQNYMPLTKAFVIATNARRDRYIGPPERLPMTPQSVALFTELFGFSPTTGVRPPNVKAPGNIFVPQHFYFDAYVSQNQKNLTCRVQHAPIFAMTQTDCISVIETNAP
jgi:hypothetical protein